MSRVPPGLQYPPIEESTPIGAALRNIIDNLHYVRGRVEAQSAVPIITTTQVQTIVKQLLPSGGSGTTQSVFIVGTHLQRLTTYPPNIVNVGTAFYETDRNSIYIISNATGLSKWVYAAGVMEDSLSNQPTDLSTDDIGFTFVNTDTGLVTEYAWNGTAFITVGGYLQEVADNVTAATTIVQTRRHSTSGAATAVFGIGVVDSLEDATGTNKDVAKEEVIWSSAATDTVFKRWSLLVAGVMTAIMNLDATGLLTILGKLAWLAGTAFTGTLNHANTANRVYTFPDETGSIVYETSNLTANNFVLGANGGAKVKDAGYATVPVASGGTGAVTAAAARASLGAAAAQAPGAHTITLAKITGGGADGSISWDAEGVITAFVDPT